MKKNILKSVCLGISVAVIALTPGAGRAQDVKKDALSAKEKKEATTSEKSNRAMVFRGKIDAVDKTAKSIKVGERVFSITSETKFTKAGKPATFGDAVVGEEIAGTYRIAETGALNASSLRFGPKPEAKGEKATKEKKAKKES